MARFRSTTGKKNKSGEYKKEYTRCDGDGADYLHPNGIQPNTTGDDPEGCYIHGAGLQL